MSNETTPKWREDFPIEWGADHYVTRREFTKFLVLTSAATFFGNTYFLLQNYRERHEKFPSTPIARTDELAIGGVKSVRYPDADSPALLIRLRDGEYVAYLQRCTHLSCPVHFTAKTNRLECPCHNGAFDVATGNVLEGPPPRPLPRIRLRVAGDQIFAEGVQGI